MKALLFFSGIVLKGVLLFAQANIPAFVESDYIIKDFKFESGETLPQLNMHYTTVGKPIKDKNGKIINGILIMHGTTGNGHQFLTEQYAGYLFNPGQILDADKYYIILPDAVGHGKSGKPSNGLHMKFPKYSGERQDQRSDCGIKAITKGVSINHGLRFLLGQHFAEDSIGTEDQHQDQ